MNAITMRSHEQGSCETSIMKPRPSVQVPLAGFHVGDALEVVAPASSSSSSPPSLSGSSFPSLDGPLNTGAFVFHGTGCGIGGGEVELLVLVLVPVLVLACGLVSTNCVQVQLLAPVFDVVAGIGAELLVQGVMLETASSVCV